MPSSPRDLFLSHSQPFSKDLVFPSSMSYKYSRSAAWQRYHVTKDVLVPCPYVGPLMMKDDINLAIDVDSTVNFNLRPLLNLTLPFETVQSANLECEARPSSELLIRAQARLYLWSRGL